MEGTKKLTQAQRAYFIKRIDEITTQKMSEVCNRRMHIRDTYYHTKANRSEMCVDKTTFKGIVSGKVKLLSKKDIRAHINECLDNNNNSHMCTTAAHFIDQASLISFNKAKNVKISSEAKKQKARINAIQETASELKDKVMLEGNLAIGMLDKFEKKKF